jgi:hypothetical protein
MLEIRYQCPDLPSVLLELTGGRLFRVTNEIYGNGRKI